MKPMQIHVDAVRTIAATVLQVNPNRITVAMEQRVSDKDGQPMVACDIRLDGELLNAVQEAELQEVFRLIREAAAITSEARAEGVAVTVKR